MITLDQVRLLDEKIESCLAKIAELNAENDALRRKCAELTNALSAKSESLSSFQQDQNKIEEGILKALERLNAVESSILSVATSSAVGSAVPQGAVQPAMQQNVGLGQMQRPAQPIQPVQQVQQPNPSTSSGTGAVQVQQPVQQQPMQNQEPQAPLQNTPSTGSTGSPTAGAGGVQSQNEYDEMPTFDIF